MNLHTTRFKVEIMCDYSLWQQPEDKVVVEYVSDKPALEDADGNIDPAIQDFLRVFEKFAIPEEMFLETTKVSIHFA